MTAAHDPMPRRHTAREMVWSATHMRFVGLVGGIGPESTVDYYRRLIGECGRRRPGATPHFLIHSINAATLLDYAARDRDRLTAYLLDAILVLQRAGADLVAFCSNTPHLVFDALTRQSPLPLVGIVGTVAAAAHDAGFRRVGLLGTGFTMKARFYPDAFAERGITLVTPRDSEQADIHQRYVDELAHGVFTPDTRERVAAVIARMADEDRVDAIVLGGTELPLLLEADTACGLPLLNSAALHVTAIVEHMLAP